MYMRQDVGPTRPTSMGYLHPLTGPKCLLSPSPRPPQRTWLLAPQLVEEAPETRRLGRLPRCRRASLVGLPLTRLLWCQRLAGGLLRVQLLLRQPGDQRARLLRRWHGRYQLRLCELGRVLELARVGLRLWEERGPSLREVWPRPGRGARPGRGEGLLRHRARAGGPQVTGFGGRRFWSMSRRSMQNLGEVGGGGGQAAGQDRMAAASGRAAAARLLQVQLGRPGCGRCGVAEDVITFLARAARPR
jgi:hypothetical protein